jgi:5-hydroxyisourate hydrolase
MTVSTHVLDTSIGRPAGGVSIRLTRLQGSSWKLITEAVTDEDGRVPALVSDSDAASTGTYRLTFDVAGYFAARQQDTFYAEIAIDFIVRDESQHYHVPLLVSPFGYSTYRGS